MVQVEHTIKITVNDTVIVLSKNEAEQVYSALSSALNKPSFEVKPHHITPWWTTSTGNNIALCRGD